MSESNPYIERIKDSAGIRLAVLFGSFFVLLILTSVIAALIGEIPAGSERDKQLASTAVQCVLAFCIPAFILAKFCSKRPLHWLKLDGKVAVRGIGGVVLVYLITLPGMEWLIEWNQSIHFPEGMSGLENLLRGWEENASHISEMMLDVTGFWSIFIGVVVIGVLTGFSEELFFRGGLQGIFTASSMGRNLAVWSAAFIFSCMHFQFFGFLPRLLMGAFFGYLLVWTGSLWIPIFAHALNNSLVVVLTGLGFAEANSQSGGFFGDTVYPALISVALTIVFFLFFRSFFFGESDKSVEQWPRKPLPPLSGK